MKDIVYVKLVTCTKFNNKNTATVNTTLTLKKSSNKKTRPVKHGIWLLKSKTYNHEWCRTVNKFINDPNDLLY